VNIHSSAFTGGEIRGQILLYTSVFVAELDAAQASMGNGGGAVASMGMGQGIFAYTSSTMQLQTQFTFSGLVGGVTAAHIHGPGMPTDNAKVLIGFTVTSILGAHAGAFASMDTCNAQCMWYLVSGLTYLNIHTSSFGGGEIRGRIWPTLQVEEPNTDSTGSYIQQCLNYMQMTPAGPQSVYRTTCTQTDATTDVTTAWIKIYLDSASCMADYDGTVAGLLAITQMGITYIAGASEFVPGYDYSLMTTSSFEAVAGTLAFSSFNMPTAQGGFNCGASVCGADFAANVARTITAASGTNCGTQCMALQNTYQAVKSQGSGQYASDLFGTMPGMNMTTGWFTANQEFSHMTWQANTQCVDFVSQWGKTRVISSSTGGKLSAASSVQASAVAGVAAVVVAAVALLL